MLEARTHKLADVDCRNAKGKAKLYKLGDGGGLALWVTPDGDNRCEMATAQASRWS